MLSFDITDRNIRVVKGVESNGKIKISSAAIDIPQSIELARDQTGNSGKVLLGPLLQQKGEPEQTTLSLACLLPKQRQTSSLLAGRVVVCLGVQLEGWLGCFAYPLGGGVCRGHVQYPAFAPNTLFLLQASQKWQLGF